MKHSKTAQPLNLNKVRGTKTPRNAFDMSFHSIFTSPTGMILPSYVQDVQPGDFLKLNVSNFTRTVPVNTAAYSRLKEVTDFYFVPYRLLWRWFDQFYTGVNDFSTAYKPSSDIPSQIPKTLSSDIYTVLSDVTSVDQFGFKLSKGAERLLDLLGFPVSNDSTVTNADLYSKLQNMGAARPTFNCFRLLAYQKIFFDFYRNTDYDPNDATYYNIDNYASGGTIATDIVKKILTPRYVQWKKDRMTAVKPTPLATMGSSAAYENTKPDFGEGLSYNLNNYINPTSNITTDASQQTVYGAKVADNGSELVAMVNMSQLRATLAYDRLARVTMLSPKTYDDQIKAHFGVDPDACDYCRPRYLGSFDSSLNIGEVTATSTGTDGDSSNVLGQIAGKGISASNSNRPITANFKEPGLVMGMHYFLPFSNYDSNRIDDFNRKFTRNDYFVPEYDALGLQPILASSVKIKVTEQPTSDTFNRVMAYQARYLEYKTRVDEVHGQFQSKQPLSIWTCPRSVVASTGFISANDMYVNPKVTDTIFPLAYDGDQKSDPFLCHFRYDANLVRNMSVLGIPTL